ncbi:hypothetical protein GCM10023323_29220 [Streptomyces thinghirensis]|uniref:Transposase n=1 Tax=Streptomyces thinghirensis TaxID=551547 RepID=A0ABP9T4R6_9ACTN
MGIRIRKVCTLLAGDRRIAPSTESRPNSPLVRARYEPAISNGTRTLTPPASPPTTNTPEPSRHRRRPILDPLPQPHSVPRNVSVPGRTRHGLTDPNTVGSLCCFLCETR